MTVDQHTQLFGVVGHPIGHSLSPIMHNAAFAERGVNAVYLAFETEDIEACIKGVRALGINGMSVTIPHKSSVIPLLDEIDPLARKIGAVNTVVNKSGNLKGYNTDAPGALNALEEKTTVRDKSCLIIGAGGAARAIGYILKEKGAKIIISNRTIENGEELSRSLSCPFIPFDELGRVKAELLVQTTPVGMSPNCDNSIVPEHILKEGMVVMDIIYNPLNTRLLESARAQGCITINGLDMFIGQGAEQFRLWTGLEAPVSTMIGVVKKELNAIGCCLPEINND